MVFNFFGEDSTDDINDDDNLPVISKADRLKSLITTTTTASNEIGEYKVFEQYDGSRARIYSTITQQITEDWYSIFFHRAIKAGFTRVLLSSSTVVGSQRARSLGVSIGAKSSLPPQTQKLI